MGKFDGLKMPMVKAPSFLELVKYVSFLCVCASVMASFFDHRAGFLLIGTPEGIRPLLFCFVFTVLFDLVHRKNENSTSNAIEKLVAVIVFPMGVFFYGLSDVALSIVVLTCASVLFCLKMRHLVVALFLSVNINSKIKSREGGSGN